MFLVTLHHNALRVFLRDTYLSVPRGIARGIFRGLARGGPRDHLHVDSRGDARGVPRILPKTHACTEQDDTTIPTTYRTTNSSYSERAQK